MRKWLERELRRELARVEAPQDLWERIEHRGTSATQGRRIRVWPIAAILTVALAIGTLWMAVKGEEPQRRQLAVERGRDRGPAACLSCHLSI